MTTTPTADAATATMVSLIGSLAENKSALGRRYGEWAVSAPTIESAVAAAAMAQDELGHARSTYPVLAKLGVTREEDTLQARFPLAVIERELPDWASVIAANLVVDGVLTTFVASARESSIESLAQRARKILQEEGAHRLHAEAWARRILSRGCRRPSTAAHRINETWAAPPAGRARRDPGYREAVVLGMVERGPAEVRKRVGEWLTALLREHGRRLRSKRTRRLGRMGRRAPGGMGRRAPAMTSKCPFCGSSEVELSHRSGGRHHQPVPLPGLQHVLRGGRGGVRRRPAEPQSDG